MKKIRRFAELLLAAAMLITLVSCGGGGGGGPAASQPSKDAGSGEKIKIKVSLTTPKTHENYIRTEEMCNAINEDCGGVFDFELYPSDALGD